MSNNTYIIQQLRLAPKLALSRCVWGLYENLMDGALEMAKRTFDLSSYRREITEADVRCLAFLKEKPTETREELQRIFNRGFQLVLANDGVHESWIVRWDATTVTHHPGEQETILIDFDTETDDLITTLRRGPRILLYDHVQRLHKTLTSYAKEMAATCAGQVALEISVEEEPLVDLWRRHPEETREELQCAFRGFQLLLSEGAHTWILRWDPVHNADDPHETTVLVDFDSNP